MWYRAELVLRRRAQWSGDLHNLLTRARQLRVISETGLSPGSA